jgi:hypothetical protein
MGQVRRGSASPHHRRRGTRSNGRTIRRLVIDQRAFSGLTEKLVPAEAVAEAVRAYDQEFRTNRVYVTGQK